MATFKKAVLKVGETMQSPDGPVKITAARLANFAAQHQRLTAAKYDVPSRWDHATNIADLLPLATEDFKAKLDGRHAVGKMVGFDYQPGATQAELTLEISDPRAIEQCESNRVKVSPVIAAAWKDGHGNQYSDFISHADLVERPVDHTQGPFVPVAPATIACSLEPRWLSAETIKLAFPPDDDKAAEGKEKSGDEPPKAEGETPDPASAEPPAKNPDSPPKATDKTKNAAALEGLKQKGIVLPSDFDFSGDAAIVILLAAINSSVAADLKSQSEKDEQEDDDDPPTVASPGYAAMSTEQKGNAAFALLEKKHRQQLAKDIDQLLADGRCTPLEANERKAALGTVKLALDDAGNEVPGDIEKFVASRQPCPKGTFWDDKQRTAQRLSTEVAPAPENLGGEPTDAEVAERVKGQLQRTGFAK